MVSRQSNQKNHLSGKKNVPLPGGRNLQHDTAKFSIPMEGNFYRDAAKFLSQ
jgi:hypothetical protein